MTPEEIAPRAFAELEEKLAERKAAGLPWKLIRARCGETVVIDPETDELALMITFAFVDGTSFFIISTEPFPLLELSKKLHAQGQTYVARRN